MGAMADVGLAVHREKITAVVAESEGEVFDYREVSNCERQLRHLVRGLERSHEEV
jgi:hypothetical protein